MKTIAFVAFAVLLGGMILFTIGAAHLPVAWDDLGKAANLNGAQAASQSAPSPIYDLVLALHAVEPADLASPPSALDGAPGLPLPPR